MQPHILSAEGLTKSYGGRRVVDDLDLRCSRGSVLGLLGPNGAGKTTTLRMLYGFVVPQAGTIHYEGRDFRAHRAEIKRLIGVCTQEDSLDYDFTVRQNLEVYASYFRPRSGNLRGRVDSLLDRFALRAYADHRPRELSGGYKKRLLIARSVVHEPLILFLDEPTTGLDPKARVDVWEIIDDMRAEGMAIVLTTHYMDEAERLSDDLLVISAGRGVARGAPGAVIGELLGEHVVVVPVGAAQREAIDAWLREHGAAPPHSVLGELRAPVTTEQLGRFSERFAGARFHVRAPNLDDLFLALSTTADAATEPGP